MRRMMVATRSGFLFCFYRAGALCMRPWVVEAGGVDSAEAWRGAAASSSQQSRRRVAPQAGVTKHTGTGSGNFFAPQHRHGDNTSSRPHSQRFIKDAAISLCDGSIGASHQDRCSSHPQLRRGRASMMRGARASPPACCRLIAHGLRATV